MSASTIREHAQATMRDLEAIENLPHREVFWAVARCIAHQEAIIAALDASEEMPDRGGDHRLVPDPQDVEP